MKSTDIWLFLLNFQITVANIRKIRYKYQLLNKSYEKRQHNDHLALFFTKFDSQ